MAERLIRTTREAPFFCLWRDAPMLEALARREYLTVARYEPILRRQLGSGHVDLLFESERQSCVIGGLRIDASNLITRERSPLIWPAAVAAVVDHGRLREIEAAIVPWLRSMARARPMAGEAIRRFARSERFDRARAVELVGAAPLARTMPHMAPFVYARRFAKDARVMIDCEDGALGQAVLADIAGVVEQVQAGGDNDAFARAWYGTPAQQSGVGTPDIVLVDRRGALDAAIVIETSPAQDSLASMVAFPSPAPWDLLFSFDPVDAPTVSRFGLYAAEAPIRAWEPLPPVRVVGGSSGTIVLAVDADSLAMRGPDIEEAEILAGLLAGEGFRVHFASQVTDPALGEAQLLHIFGARFEAHTVAFAEAARERGVAYVFDLPPIPANASTFLENSLTVLYRAALDDAGIARYVRAYEDGRLDANGVPGPSAEDYSLIEARFTELTEYAAAVLCIEEDRATLCETLSRGVAERLYARGAFAQAEPDAGAVGHLVPRSPLAFAHGPIAARSHLLYAAIAADRLAIPFVIAGPVYDVDYLQILRASAPDAIVLADSDAATVSALYRHAAIWVDTAPRPRSMAPLIRAVACGALPVLALNSPFSRIAGSDAPTFSATCIDDCARVMQDSLAASDRHTRLAALRVRLLGRRDPAAAFGTVLAAYSRASSIV